METSTAVPPEVERARKRCEERAWADAFEAFSRADENTPLGPGDLERYAVSAYLTGRQSYFRSAFERAHAAHLEAGDIARAVRCAFWLGLVSMLKGETGRGSGWLSTAGRLIERHQLNTVEKGYLLLPMAERSLGESEPHTAHAIASEAVAIGECFGDADLVACARHLQGRAHIAEGRVEDGLGLLDEAMLPVSTGDLFPLMTGLIYCSVIEACQKVYALARAREWTEALAHWCEDQPQMVAFSATCLVHRAEIMQWRGAWPEAIREAQRACKQIGEVPHLNPPAAALYRQAEVYRLRGDFESAEAGYGEASRLGFDPQPGLALMRLGQRRVADAARTIRRGLEEADTPPERIRLLPAFVEIMLAAGHLDDADAAGRELTGLAEQLDTQVVAAMAAQTAAQIALAKGDPRNALASLRRASETWRRVEAPYEAACAQLLTGLACLELGDRDGAKLELDSARRSFETLGALPDLARLDALTRSPESAENHGLTPRELEVLRLVASGMTNKAIAAKLGLSGKTVDRHVSNIFNKLDVPSRAAATAYALRQDLV